MLATETVSSISLADPGIVRASRAMRGWGNGALMILPALAFLLVFFIAPAAVLFRTA